MYKAAQSITPLLRIPAIGIATIFFAGCAVLESDKPLVSFGKSKSTNNYTWGDFLKDTDNNGDATVQLDEFNGYLIRQRGQAASVTSSFSEMDLNANGSIDESEFNALSETGAVAVASNVQPWVDFQFGADRNDSGGVSLNEWINMSPRQANTPGPNLFSEYDLNGDGQVDSVEYRTVSKQ